MTTLNRRNLLIASSVALIVTPMAGLMAEGHGETVVEMLNKNPDDPKTRMVFYPRIMVVKPGDVILFKATDKGHNSASIEGMLPVGEEAWKGKINKDIEVKFDVPGIYGYQCTPHASVGMVGLVIVEGPGKLDNLEEAKSAKQRGRAKKVWKEIWEVAEADGLLNT